MSDRKTVMLIFDVFLQVPESYLRAIFGSFLASRFIYSMGISASPVSFFAFMNERMTHLTNGAQPQ